MWSLKISKVPTLHLVLSFITSLMPDLPSILRITLRNSTRTPPVLLPFRIFHDLYFKYFASWSISDCPQQFHFLSKQPEVDDTQYIPQLLFWSVKISYPKLDVIILLDWCTTLESLLGRTRTKFLCQQCCAQISAYL